MKTRALSAIGRRTKAPPISWLMATTLARPKLISLAAGFTDHATLPRSAVRDLLQQMLRSPASGEAALQYGSTAGDPVLRRLTARRFLALDGASGRAAAWSPDRIIIANGSQQILYILTEALCDPGDIVLLEDPTYFVYLGILQSHGLAARTVQIRPDGLDLVHLEQVLEKLRRSGDLRRVKLLYLVSYHQNPTSITTSLEKKAGALGLLRHYERAAGHPLYLLEDAAYRELRFAGDDIPSALSLRGGGERVLHAGTYSKPFATGIRVGFAVLPEPVYTAVLRIKGNHDFGTSNLLQQLLARALGSGDYDRHLRELQARYAHKSHVMRAAIREYFPSSIQWREPQGGLYFWARLPQRVKTGPRSKLFAAALAKQVLYVPGELCYAPDPTRPAPNHEMRLSFGAASEANLRAGIRRLGVALHQFLSR